jgi:hypothetical protein
LRKIAGKAIEKPIGIIGKIMVSSRFSLKPNKKLPNYWGYNLICW